MLETQHPYIRTKELCKTEYFSKLPINVRLEATEWLVKEGHHPEHDNDIMAQTFQKFLSEPEYESQLTPETKRLILDWFANKWISQK